MPKIECTILPDVNKMPHSYFSHILPSLNISELAYNRLMWEREWLSESPPFLFLSHSNRTSKKL